MPRKSFQELLAEGHPATVRINGIMNSPAYTRMYRSPEGAAARAEVDAFFKAAYGTEPAADTVHNNTTTRGGRDDQ